MKQATEEAKRLVNAAQEESEQMRRASLAYTNDLLAEAQQHVGESLRETDNKYRMLTSALKNSIQVMRSNREELMSQLEPEKYLKKQQAAENEAAAADQPETAEQNISQEETGKENFYVPEDAFLKDMK